MQEILGHFSAGAKLYSYVFQRLPDPSLVVELGCFLGMSTDYMVRLIKQSDKQVEFHVVDLFTGQPANDGSNYLDRDFYQDFHDNMKARNNLDYIQVHRMATAEAAKAFADNSCDFVYIDADHSYENVKQDIASWFPKVKPYGILAGDDWQKIGVRRAVTESFLSDPNRMEEQPPWEMAWSGYRYKSFQLLYSNQWMVTKDSVQA